MSRGAAINCQRSVASKLPRSLAVGKASEPQSLRHRCQKAGTNSEGESEKKKETEGENGNGPSSPLLIRRLPHHRQFLFAPVPLDNCPSPCKSHESDAT